MFHFRSYHYAIKSSIYIFIAFNGSVMALKGEIIFLFCNDHACQSIKPRLKLSLLLYQLLICHFKLHRRKKNLTDALVLRETSQSVLWPRPWVFSSKFRALSTPNLIYISELAALKLYKLRKPRYNEPLYNEVFSKLNERFYLPQLYEKDPRYNETSFNKANKFVHSLGVVPLYFTILRPDRRLGDKF